MQSQSWPVAPSNFTLKLAPQPSTAAMGGQVYASYSSNDEGIEMASSTQSGSSPPLIIDTLDEGVEPMDEPPRKRLNSVTAVYQCTFPDCSHHERGKRAIHQHIIHDHLNGDTDEILEFYYKIVEAGSVMANTTGPKNPVRSGKSGREIKKCRKVYGMDNRELWCNQCKWKKACTRFEKENACKDVKD